MRLPYLRPRWYQIPVFRAYSEGIKRFLITWPRRHGKDVTSAQLLLMEAMKRVGNYWYLFPTRAWAERAIWNNTQEIVIDGKKRAGKLLDILFPDELVASKHEKDLKIVLINGSVIQFSGTDNLDFVGQGGYGYILSEYSLHRPDVTSYISPILEEADAFLVMNGTLRGKQNHLYQSFETNFSNPSWFTQWLTPDITKQYYWSGDDIQINPELKGVINLETGRPYRNIQDLVDSGEISYALARQEFLNEAVLNNEKGYYAHEYKAAMNDGRIGSAKYDHTLPVFTFWDLGKGTAQKCTDAMSVWYVQFPKDDLPKPSKISLIDYEESRGQAWSEHARKLNSKGYMYGNHYAPWDINKGIAGVEGNNLQWAKESGIDFVPVPRRSNGIMNSIEICRRKWKICSFSEKTFDTVDSLASYHEKTDRNGIGMGVPEHDNSSNLADSFRLMCEAIELGIVRQKASQDNMEWVADFKFDGYFD